ncbi:cytosolic Fe-S cluster assembly factor NUBP2 homolog isoform X1 [Schistocerca gregaria]|uniref:cytosolic Fe-S cluster assembly factor NUBP2 homolog isoform X1 n=1 Tax=Schistocerca gregaria TaxID=7010 RepID=UPI00211F39F9|nr:cytosolic Fe-S cluster assembly factor NUBP2 homolog isoform X1 [Schistocerca gregaria]
MLDGVKHIILVLSGKGGVGKSTISTQLAYAFRDSGYKVGLLDIDLCGPSIPYLLHLQGKDVHQCPQGWVPVYADKEKQLAVMSIGFLLKNDNDSIVWRGPKKTAMIKQFLTDVFWEDIDYLIIDTPPGTSDEHITVMENLRTLNCDGAILVTTPQALAVEDVTKELTFCRKTGIPVVGVIENMSGYVCPSCAECTNIFSSGGGKSLADLAKVPFLGCVPIDPRIGKCADSGESYAALAPESPVTAVLKSIVQRVTVTSEVQSTEKT